MKNDILSAITKNTVYAIIPARSGSKGVKNKNIKCLLGYPMLAYSIAAAKLSQGIDRVIVSTDSERYAEIAKYYGAEAPFIRPAELADDNAKDIDFMEHLINWLYENEGRVPEWFVHLRPTYPLRDPKVVEKAIYTMKSDSSASSLRSAHIASVSPFKWFLRSNDGYFQPMYDDMTLDDTNKPRQIFPDVYIPDGYVDLLSTSNIVRNDTIHGDKMIGFVVEDGVDVDTVKDFEKLEEIMPQQDNPIISYLRENFKPLEEVGL